MPADLLVRIDLDYIFPDFLDAVLEMLVECRKEGAEYFAISGYRSPSEQAKLYFQGRTMPGPIVTDARQYYSAHNYGIAIDFCRDANAERKGLQPEWGDGSYEELGRQAKRLGLVWGGDFARKDRPHVQWPGFITGRELEPLKASWANAAGTTQQRLRRVWAEII